MSRVPYPVYDALSDAKREVMDGSEGRVVNVSRMSMYAPDAIWRSHRTLGRACAFGGSMDERLRELVIMRVAYISNSEYELYHHLKIAQNCGVTEQERAATESGDFSGLPDKERALLTFADEVIRNVSPTDQTLAEMRKHFSLEHVFETVILAGSYMITARVAAVSGCENDDGGPITEWKAYVDSPTA